MFDRSACLCQSCLCQVFARSSLPVRIGQVGVRQSLEQKVGLSPADSAFREQMGKDRRFLSPPIRACTFCTGRLTGFEIAPLDELACHSLFYQHHQSTADQLVAKSDTLQHLGRAISTPICPRSFQARRHLSYQTFRLFLTYRDSRRSCGRLWASSFQSKK